MCGGESVSRRVGRAGMPDLQGIKKAKSKGKKKNPGPQDFKKQKVKVGRKVSAGPRPASGRLAGLPHAGCGRRWRGRRGSGAQRACGRVCVRGRAGLTRPGARAAWAARQEE